MNNTTNLSAPTSPSGNIVEATANSLSTKSHNITKNLDSEDKAAGQQKQNSEDHKPSVEPVLSRSLGDISPGDSSGEPPVEASTETPAPTSETLKVKIKTNNISASTTNPSTNDRNNNTSNNFSSIINKSIESPTISSKNSASPASTPKSANSKAGGRKGKQNNADTSSATSNSTSSSINSSFSSTRSESPATSNAMNAAKTQPIMNNHQGGSPPAENGKKAMPSSAPVLMAPTPLSTQSSQVQPSQPMPATLQTQSQQQPLPLTPQPKASAPPPPTVPPTNLSVSTPSSASTTLQTTPKPKATRAKKPPAANNKNTNATDAINPPKPEAKTRTKKAKQTTESKKDAAAAASASTPAKTLASTQPLLPISSATTSAAPTVASSSAPDKKVVDDQRQSSSAPAKKRKPRATPAADPNAQPTNAPKRTRKKKGDQAPATQPTNDTTTHTNPLPPLMSSNMTLPPLSVNPQLLSVASNVPMGASPLMSNAPQPMYPGMQPLNRNMPGISPLDVHDHHQRYVSVSLSPYANLETNSLARQHSLSKLLFTSSSGTSALPSNPHSDEISKAFEELKDYSWTHLSKCILEPAQQFDLPSLIGTLHELRADNERQLKRVKDLTLQREQLAAMNAKLDLSGPMLMQNLNQTSPSFASVAAALQNSPKSLPNSSPSPAMNKSPIVPSGAYNHVPPGSSRGPPSILYDRNSPMVGLQTQHSGVNSLKSSLISTPSPPTSAFMAHGANNRAGLMTVSNSPYMSSVHPSISALNPLGGQAPPSYYPRQ